MPHDLKLHLATLPPSKLTALRHLATSASYAKTTWYFLQQALHETIPEHFTAPEYPTNIQLSELVLAIDELDRQREHASLDIPPI